MLCLVFELVQIEGGGDRGLGKGKLIEWGAQLGNQRETRFEELPLLQLVFNLGKT